MKRPRSSFVVEKGKPDLRDGSSALCVARKLLHRKRKTRDREVNNADDVCDTVDDLVDSGAFDDEDEKNNTAVNTQADPTGVMKLHLYLAGISSIWANLCASG